MRAVGKGPGGQCLGPSESHRSCEGPMRALGAAADGGLAGPLWKARGLGLVSLSVLHRGPEYTSVSFKLNVSQVFADCFERKTSDIQVKPGIVNSNISAFVP